MKKLSKILLFVLLWCFSVISAAQENTSKGILFHQNESWEKILELAKKENKMIFMDCYTTWCGPCKALAKEVFPQEKVGNFFNPRFINVQYDMEKGDGKMLYVKYKKNIVGFPTLLLIDKEENVLQQMAGYQEADQLIEGIRKASEGKDLFTLRKQYYSGERSLEFIKEYLGSLTAAFLRDSVAAVAADYLKNMDLKELDKDDVWEVLGVHITDINSPAFGYLVRNIDRYYYHLHRDRYKMSRQLETGVNRELRRIIKIDFDDHDQPLPLVQDSEAGKRIIKYMSDAGLRRINEVRAQLFIHDLLLEQNYAETWRYLNEFSNIGFTGFSSGSIHDYIRFMMAKTKDKKMLKEFLQKLTKYEATGEKGDFSYHMYKTMAQLNKSLGNRKMCEECMENFDRINKQRLKEVEEFLKNN